MFPAIERLRVLWGIVKGPSEKLLDIAMLTLLEEWAHTPFLTKEPIATNQIEDRLTEEWANAFIAFHVSPPYKLVQLIGAAACGGVWDGKMSEVCYRAASFGGNCLNEEELAVVTELYERMTIDVTEGGNRIRTQAELNDIIAFWWKLQDYRTQWLQKTGRADTDAVTLTVEEVREVRAELIY